MDFKLAAPKTKLLKERNKLLIRKIWWTCSSTCSYLMTNVGCALNTHSVSANVSAKRSQSVFFVHSFCVYKRKCICNDKTTRRLAMFHIQLNLWSFRLSLIRWVPRWQRERIGMEHLYRENTLLCCRFNLKLNTFSTDIEWHSPLIVVTTVRRFVEPKDKLTNQFVMHLHLN